MNYILCTFLAFLTANSSVSSQTSAKWNSNLSSGEIKLNRAIHPAAIDMDYFGESDERRLSPRTAEVTDKERARMDPDSSSNPIVVFINKPDVEDYRKMKKRDQGTSSENDSTVGFKDVIQFLIQVDARLKEQEGRPINPDSHENVKLINFLRDFRRRNDGEYIDDISDTEEESNKVKQSSIERKPAKRTKKVNADRFPKSRVKLDRLAPKNDVPIKRLKFRTPRPFIGKQGIYETN